MARIAVIGIGNVLMGDDAVGPYVVKLLEARYRFPPDVRIAEAGTPGMDLTVEMFGLDSLVVVDAVRTEGRPGEVRLFDRQSLLDTPPTLALSPHEPALREALLTLEFSGDSPKQVILVGIIPHQVTTGIGLSHAARGAVGPAIEEVLRQLARLGVTAADRLPPAVPDLWWEHPRAP